MELWFTEKHTKGAGLTLKCKRTLYCHKSKFQQIDVLETEEFGRLLLLDGLVMTTERDEFFYHEMLVHPPMHYHGEKVKSVLVIGGGDGGAVRELLKYPEIERVILCEIDKEVVAVSRKFFPSISFALDDPRVEIRYADGSVILDEHKNDLDMIIIDSTDPIGAAKILFTERFYKSCRKALKKNGILCAQSESPIYHLSTMKEMKEALKAAGFPCLYFYISPVPTYPGGLWSWVMAGCNDIKIRERVQPLSKKTYDELKFFNLDILNACICLPNFIKKALSL